MAFTDVKSQNKQRERSAHQGSYCVDSEGLQRRMYHTLDRKRIKQQRERERGDATLA